MTDNNAIIQHWSIVIFVNLSTDLLIVALEPRVYNKSTVLYYELLLEIIAFRKTSIKTCKDTMHHILSFMQ